MERQYLLEQWNKLREMAIPSQAPTVQLTEMKRAFYAGAYAFYIIQMGEISVGDEIKPSDMELMKALHNEIFGFREKIMRGEA